MDLRRKIARLRTQPAAPTDTPAEPAAVTAPAEPVAPTVEAVPTARADDELRARLKAVAAKTKRRAGTTAQPAVERPPLPEWPFVVRPGDEGSVHVATRYFPVDARHGAVSLASALAVTGTQAATLGIDTALQGYDPWRALFFDTETTGLAGGTGTLAFLVGMAWFDGDALRVEQLMLLDLEHEAPMLEHIARRIADAGALVTFNGRTFDLPLLRSRFVMARVTPPAEPPHFDLLHVARRIYGARVERCNLTTLERDVLGFERVGDVDGSQIPALYQRFLREGVRARDALLPVVEHNVWDLAALAALSGELGARLAREHSDGRFEAHDLVGLARTTHRAGDLGHAVRLASEAAAMGEAAGDSKAARDAHVLAAGIHKRTKDGAAWRDRLLAALDHAPDDAALHLELSRCYERALRDPAKALVHALKAAGAEDPTAHTKRVARLRARAKKRRPEQLRLPGV